MMVAERAVWRPVFSVDLFNPCKINPDFRTAFVDVIILSIYNGERGIQIGFTVDCDFCVLTYSRTKTISMDVRNSGGSACVEVQLNRPLAACIVIEIS